MHVSGEKLSCFIHTIMISLKIAASFLATVDEISDLVRFLNLKGSHFFESSLFIDWKLIYYIF